MNGLCNAKSNMRYNVCTYEGAKRAAGAQSKYAGEKEEENAEKNSEAREIRRISAKAQEL